MVKFQFLACLCNCGDWFETHFVGNPEDRFCRVEAQMYEMVYQQAHKSLYKNPPMLSLFPYNSTFI